MEKVSKKRLYLSPSITVVEIKPHTLLVESGELHRTSEKVDDNYEALSRRNKDDEWGEDEEDTQ